MARLLVIDDDVTTLRTVEAVLAHVGHDVVKASDGQQGLDVLAHEKVDGVILDVQMPNMNGYSFIFEVKKLEDAKNLPIIVVTAKEEMEEIFKVEGVQDYLLKPIDPDQLLASVNKHITSS